MAIEKDLLDQLLAGRDPKDVFNKDGLVDELKKALSERILNAEIDEHLDGDEAKGNHRNGYSKKSVLTGTSKMTLSVPRDRAGTFDPKLIAKYQRRFPDFDDKIISMYARGMTVREIRGHLEELYGIDVSPDLISAVTDAVLDEVAEWQNRPLDICYPLVFFDAIRVKVRDEGFVRNKAIYIALGILPDGTKEILGIWIEQTEGAKFWLRVMNELKNRGAQDILIAVVDGLKGFPEAINAVFPQTVIQTCIVHLIRHSMDFAAWRIARTSRRRFGPSIARPMPRSARPPSMPSHKVRGARSIRRSRRAGAATGTLSFRSSRSPKASAKLSTQRTPSRR
jgi:putative transposase